MRRQGLAVTRSGYGLQHREICPQEISLRANRVEKWESGHHNQMTRDRIHRRVQRINAVSVQPLVRRGGAESIFRSAAVGAVTSMRGVADVASFEETVARSEWCDQVRDSC